jgi:hypothetical protein
MPDIFISYRRDDSSGHAGRLFDCMRGRFGNESVFMDVTNIQPGIDFTQAFDRALSSCRVCSSSSAPVADRHGCVRAPADR